jgi:hypothetical protein
LFGPGGKEFARAAFSPQESDRIERGARKLGITVRKLVRLAIEEACRERGAFAALGRSAS